VIGAFGDMATSSNLNNTRHRDYFALTRDENKSTRQNIGFRGQNGAIATGYDIMARKIVSPKIGSKHRLPFKVAVYLSDGFLKAGNFLLLLQTGP